MNTRTMSLREFNSETSGHDKVVVEWFDKYFVVNSDDLLLTDYITIYFDDEGHIKDEWLSGIEVLGITSGASAPEYLVDNLINYVKGENPEATIENMDVLKEEIKFPLPDDLVSLAEKSEKGIKWVEKHKVASQR